MGWNQPIIFLQCSCFHGQVESRLCCTMIRSPSCTLVYLGCSHHLDIPAVSNTSRFNSEMNWFCLPSRAAHNATKHHRTPAGSGCGLGRRLTLHPSGLAGEHHPGALCTSVAALWKGTGRVQVALVGKNWFFTLCLGDFSIWILGMILQIVWGYAK